MASFAKVGNKGLVATDIDGVCLCDLDADALGTYDAAVDAVNADEGLSDDESYRRLQALIVGTFVRAEDGSEFTDLPGIRMFRDIVDACKKELGLTLLGKPDGESPEPTATRSDRS